ncbi:S-adenosyl-L-methionine-dependent methyltransferase [Sphaerosporella brunnea]|uniref:S-adenosyl-L-methionine-dependent methyltransferase n=1 Tax=Sphaerosporella brunnea TaxID=1250544 RepID=A0A5J5ELK3_9PEZI|nr:S-adenosyl-L-methionine-dependent methyltransferase [Sphaerosporella brunnea]
MPRLPPTLLRHAYKASPYIPALMRATRALDTAKIELRWLREHAATQPRPSLALQNFVFRRSFLAEPLQYILGSQPFGAVDILCRRGVLIPRAETEESASHLAALLAARGGGAKVVDLCTGTGCIPLLLAAEAQVQAVGVDISPRALALAMRNVRHNIGALKPGSRVEIVEGDLLAAAEEIDQLLYSMHACFDEMDPEGLHHKVDVVISNPPYISADGYKRETTRSVRNWEPRLALEAENGGDVFYPRIGGIAMELGADAVVAEVGGWDQAERVQAYWKEMGWIGTAVWKDFAGRGRTVVGWTDGGEWIKDGPHQ